MAVTYPHLTWPRPRTPRAARPRDFVRLRLEQLEARDLFATSFGPTPDAFFSSTASSAFIFSAVPSSTAQNFQTTSTTGLSSQPSLVQSVLALTSSSGPQVNSPTAAPFNQSTPSFTSPAVQGLAAIVSTQSSAVLPISSSPVYSFIPVELQLLEQLYAPGGYRTLNQLPPRATFNLSGGGGEGVEVPRPAGRPVPPAPTLPPETEFLKYTRMLSLADPKAEARPVPVEDVDHTFELLSRPARADTPAQDEGPALIVEPPEPPAAPEPANQPADERPAPTDPLPSLHEAPVDVAGGVAVVEASEVADAADAAA